MGLFQLKLILWFYGSTFTIFWRHSFCFSDLKMTGKEPALHTVHSKASVNNFVPHQLSWSINQWAVSPNFHKGPSSSYGLPESVSPAPAQLHKRAPEESQPSLTRLSASACFQRAAPGHGRRVLPPPGKLLPRKRWPPLLSNPWPYAGLDKGLPWQQQHGLGRKRRIVEMGNAL